MTALALALLLAARPVQAPFRGEVESLDFAGQSTGVLATFAPGTKLEQGKAAIDACSPKGAGVRAGFLRTEAGQLAVVHPAEPANGRSLLALATCLSRQHGVSETHAFFFPAVENSAEVEAVWRFKGGERVERTVFSFRDDPEYSRWLRRVVSWSEFLTHQWDGKWPLSLLAKKLGLSGRAVLEQPGSLMWERGVPKDAGDNLVLVTFTASKGEALAMLQEAEVSKHSLSLLVTEALRAALQAKTLGDGAAETETETAEGKARVLTAFVSRPVIAEVDAVGDQKGLSFSALVADAWRRAHGEKEKK